MDWTPAPHLRGGDFEVSSGLRRAWVRDGGFTVRLHDHRKIGPVLIPFFTEGRGTDPRGRGGGGGEERPPAGGS
jgi:hypothetical protein